jgi:selenocysteine lyase/cysteine desulfurase
MTIEELHSDENLRNEEFPVTREKIFLGHAGVSPLPKRVETAIRDYLGKCTLNDQEDAISSHWLAETREIAGRFLGVSKEEVAFVGPTSLALSFVAEGLRFKRNSNVLVYQDDYPSNVYPWMTLAERGVQVRFLNVSNYGVIRPRDIAGQVDENTRLVALASCHFISGYRIDLEAIGSYLRQRKILFCVDGIQTVGAFPTPLGAVDFMACDAHKWLLGPCAAGLMYVGKEAQEQLRPVAHGWYNLRCPDYVAREDLEYKPDARRYEAGSHNFLGLTGLRASIELLDEIGTENIAAEALRKRAWVIPEIEKKGWKALQAELPPEAAGPMFSIYKAGENLASAQAKLAAEGIATSLRTNRERRHFIRISPHFYNTDAELKRLVEVL